MRTVRLILGDQLDLGIASLADIDPENDLILMAELKTEASYVKHHKKKIAFIFSAMRHFAEECRLKGLKICYIDYDSPKNKGNFISQLQSVIDEFSPGALCRRLFRSISGGLVLARWLKSTPSDPDGRAFALYMSHATYCTDAAP